MMDNLTKLERAVLHKMLAGSSEDWSAFAQAVDRGYPGCIEEYLNDLTKRDMLEELIVALPHDEGATIRRAISERAESARGAAELRAFRRQRSSLAGPSAQARRFRPMRGRMSVQDCRSPSECAVNKAVQPGKIRRNRR